MSGPIGLVAATIRRDLLHLRNEKSRWMGVLLQPLLFWLAIGSGMQGAFGAAFSEGDSYLSFFFPGIAAMIVLFTTIFSTITVIEDRQSGFLQSVLVAPVGRFWIVASKTLAITVMALIQAGLFALLAPLAGLPVAWWSALAVPAVLILSGAGLGAFNLYFAWRLKSSSAYHAMMSVVLMPMWLISGALFPVNDGVFATVAAFNPLTYMVALLRHAFGVSATTGPSVALCTILLAGFLLASTLAATRAIQRED